jgi:hypothetical protein
LGLLTGRIGTARHQRIGHHADELVHRVDRGLLGAGGDLAGDLGQAGGSEAAVQQRDAAVAVEIADDRSGDVLLVDRKALARRRNECQREQRAVVGALPPAVLVRPPLARSVPPAATVTAPPLVRRPASV